MEADTHRSNTTRSNDRSTYSEGYSTLPEACESDRGDTWKFIRISTHPGKEVVRPDEKEVEDFAYGLPIEYRGYQFPGSHNAEDLDRRKRFRRLRKVGAIIVLVVVLALGLGLGLGLGPRAHL